jgi:hypothetical protein
MSVGILIFHSPRCGWCQRLLKETLPVLQPELNSRQVNLSLIDVTQPMDDMTKPFFKQDTGVPQTIIIKQQADGSFKEVDSIIGYYDGSLIKVKEILDKIGAVKKPLAPSSFVGTAYNLYNNASPRSMAVVRPPVVLKAARADCDDEYSGDGYGDALYTNSKRMYGPASTRAYDTATSMYTQRSPRALQASGHSPDCLCNGPYASYSRCGWQN